MVSMKWSGTQTGSDPDPAASTANLGGATGLKITTTANGDPGTSAQCAVIYPQSGTIINASGYEYLNFSVKDMVNPSGCTAKVTFVDQNNNVSSAWSHETTVYENWTRIWVPVG